MGRLLLCERDGGMTFCSVWSVWRVVVSLNEKINLK